MADVTPDVAGTGTESLTAALRERGQKRETVTDNGIELIVFCGDVEGDGYVGWTPKARADANGWDYQTGGDPLLIQAADEIDRLRTTLRAIQSWDCLNPPDPNLCADHPWLRRLVDETLS